MSDASADAVLIGIDWGTTNARGFLFDAGGTIAEERHREIGISRVDDGGFGSVFRQAFGDWTSRAPQLPVLMCGMIGSRQGWSEAPYIPCPTPFSALADRLHSVPDTNIRIVRGVSTQGEGNRWDVMRGEETQVAGLTNTGAALVCLPGTHSKWAELEDGTLSDFRTYMTGELFELLTRHGILARTMGRTNFDEAAFRRGLERGRGTDTLLTELFQVRTQRLFDKLAADEQRSYLSGLLIGREVADALQNEPTGRPITIVGTSPLIDRYRTALEQFGRMCETVDGEQAAAAGLWSIAREAGLIAET